jgi:L-ascorbate metabolism protein UlaG (beta-lactamase superfamily)
MMIAGLLAAQATPDLSITLVGNAGVLLSDGTTSLLVDLPYESGAFGYMTYDPSALRPLGTAVSVVTHHHRDHFDPSHFGRREDWLILGPPSVTERLPASKVIQGDSVNIGDFAVVTIPTPHTEDHRSYRVRWRGKVLHFVGDTEVPSHLGDGPPIDLLLITPWLSCAAVDADLLRVASRSVAYHLSPDGDDRICGHVETLAQGSSFVLTAGEN